jgi:hypothetical protein
MISYGTGVNQLRYFDFSSLSFSWMYLKNCSKGAIFTPSQTARDMGFRPHSP